MNERSSVFPTDVRGSTFVPRTHVMPDLVTRVKSRGEMGDGDRIPGGLWASWPDVCNSEQQKRP